VAKSWCGSCSGVNQGQVLVGVVWLGFHDGMMAEFMFFGTRRSIRPSARRSWVVGRMGSMDQDCDCFAHRGPHASRRTRNLCLSRYFVSWCGLRSARWGTLLREPCIACHRIHLSVCA